LSKTRVAIALGIAAAIGISLLLLMRNAAGPDGEESRTPASATPAPVEAPAGIAAGGGGELRVAAGETLVLEPAAREPGRPVVLQLVLGEPSLTAEPRAVRVLGPNGRMLEGEASLGDDRMDARFEIDPAWLSPGHYLVEVQTTERSHFPVRRYVLEVR
jgi:hypothetical protein